MPVTPVVLDGPGLRLALFYHGPYVEQRVELLKMGYRETERFVLTSVEAFRLAKEILDRIHPDAESAHPMTDPG